MALQEQLAFDISHCSHCPLGAGRMNCPPIFNSSTHTLLLLESPTALACREADPWRHVSAQALAKALLHAHGPSLAGFHLTFALKCHCPDKPEKSLKEKLHWGRTCVSHYLEYEIRALRPKRLLVFGELPAKLCFPDFDQPWTAMLGETHILAPYAIETHILESPLALNTRGGLSSPAGRQWIEHLHTILGGSLSLPQSAECPTIFELFQ